ncbi:MAG: hypothetical protein ABIU05_16275 [Nitrospirales bacterium]
MFYLLCSFVLIEKTILYPNALLIIIVVVFFLEEPLRAKVTVFYVLSERVLSAIDIHRIVLVLIVLG